MEPDDEIVYNLKNHFVHVPKDMDRARAASLYETVEAAGLLSDGETSAMIRSDDLLDPPGVSFENETWYCIQLGYHLYLSRELGEDDA